MNAPDIRPAILQTLKLADESAQQLLIAFGDANLTPEQLTAAYASYISNVLQEKYIGSIINISPDIASKLVERFPKQGKEIWSMLKDLRTLRESTPTSHSTLAEVLRRANQVLTQSLQQQIGMIEVCLLKNEYSKTMWSKKT